MDYEHQPANHINFRLADSILVPFTFDLKDIRRYGATSDRLLKYPGLKEEVYLAGFNKDPSFLQNEFQSLDHKKVMCVVRPPATMAAYHNFENPIFHDLMSFLVSKAHTQAIFFPRTQDQRMEFGKLFPGMHMPIKSVNGAQLIANADLVISAGGTMIREAAALGTPAYTVYAGRMGSVDKYLMHSGKLISIDKTG